MASCFETRCFATLLSMIGLVLKSRFSTETAADMVFDTVFIAAGLIALTAMAGMLELLRKPARASRTPLAAPAGDKPAIAAKPAVDAPLLPAE